MLGSIFPEKPDHEGWTRVIQPSASWLDLRLDELWAYRDLIYLFVRRDFVARYKQTILGPLWHVIQPLFTTIIFTVVFGSIAGIPTDGLPSFLFYMSGTVVWTYFSKALTSTSNTFISNSSVFGKVYFPRLAVPISILISNLISFTIQFTFFLICLIFFAITGAPVRPTVWVLAIPLLILIMAGLGLGLGILISSLTTRYRDLTQLVGFGVTLLMYAAPIIYPLSTVPSSLQWIIALNPITPVIEAFRLALLGAGTVSLGQMLYSIVMTIAILTAGITLFSRVERTFMDTV